MRFLIAIAGLLAATPAAATDWVLATTASNRTSATYLDRDSVTTMADGHIKVNAFYLSAQDREGIAGMFIVQEYDCANQRYRRLLMRGHAADGSVIGTVDTPTEWKQGDGTASQGGLLLNFVCERKLFEQGRIGLGPEMPLVSGRRRLLEGS